MNQGSDETPKRTSYDDVPEANASPRDPASNAEGPATPRAGTPGARNKPCPECGASLVPQCGCHVCLSCGYGGCW